MLSSKNLILSAVFAVLMAPFAIVAAPDTLPDGFYRYPSVGGGAIVFAAEGDLWKVPATGGIALRLTAHEGEEAFPELSPDGRLIAFTAQYEGNDDVYVMTASGGEPRRLTFHPATRPGPGLDGLDGKILFSQPARHAQQRFSYLQGFSGRRLAGDDTA